MTDFVRENAWKAGGDFEDANGNPTSLYWYAIGVRGMMERPLNEPTSWWFYAAIHGQYIVKTKDSGDIPTDFPNWGKIPPVPEVPTSPLPDNAAIAQYWDQCQHAGWFFAPWHRGYIFALEQILRGIIVEQGGPDNWALPYWNYLKQGTDQYKMPPAFAQEKLPDGSPNPLYVTARYGPNGNGNIYVPIPPISKTCQGEKVYTNGYGGGKTGFKHFGKYTGKLEQNPHNLVHSKVGGSNAAAGIWGLMADPGIAALDPIFYMHHCNIDRMWAAWNNSGRKNPTDDAWLDGPTATGDRKFYMPMPDGSPWHYTPSMVNNTQQLQYTYDDLGIQDSLVHLDKNHKRLLLLGKFPQDQPKPMKKDPQSELIGANNGVLDLKGTGAQTTVNLDNAGWKRVTKSLKSAAVDNLPDEVYLQLEGVKGTADANVYSVTVNHHYAGHFSLFGVRKASMKDGHHGGAGLTIQLDISDIMDRLFINGQSPDSIDVLIQPESAGIEGEECIVERVSIYRVQNQ